MNCNELMIMDWVKLMNPKGEWLTNVQIDSNLFIPFLQYGEDGFVRFEPIPLTVEILEKNGFDWVEDEDELSDSEYNGYMVMYSDEEVRFYPKGSMDRYCVIEIGDTDSKYIILYINYVHELQHALRLCGLNELADNFKVKGGDNE